MNSVLKLHRFFAPLLFPFSFLYRAGFALARVSQRRGVIRFASMVVSVGNLTTGGTGKTPFVIFLAGLLKERGKTVTVVSRGYRRRTQGKAIIDLVKDAREDGGDEPWLISLKTGVPVIVSNTKHGACEHAIETYGPDVLILDDGFQSFSIARDLDIVLIDATEELGTLLIPAGPLREPVDAVRRADAIIMTRCNQVDEEALCALTKRIGRFSGAMPLFRSSHEVHGVVRTAGDAPADPGILRKKRMIAVSAIGNNRSFLRSLSGLGFNVVQSMSFLDHHRYTEGDVAVLSEMAVSYSADAVVTTEKDFYSLRSFVTSIPVPLYALSIRIALDDRERFAAFCKKKGVL
jgi:tetraacyldisaccharide 4'-kinase